MSLFSHHRLPLNWMFTVPKREVITPHLTLPLLQLEGVLFLGRYRGSCSHFFDVIISSLLCVLKVDAVVTIFSFIVILE